MNDLRHKSVRLAIEHFVVAAKDSVVVDTPTLRLIYTPSVPQGPVNLISRTRFKEATADESIQEALVPFRSHHLPCWWMLGPESEPQDLEKRLIRRFGFTIDHHAYGLVLPPGRDIRIRPDPDIVIEKATPDNLESYIWASTDGRNSAEMRNYMLQAMEREGDRLEWYYARYRGEPAGTGVSILHGGEFASLSSGYVRERFRKLGIYSRLVEKRVRCLKERGVPRIAVISKVETSAPVLMKLGFERVWDLTTLVRGSNHD